MTEQGLNAALPVSDSGGAARMDLTAAAQLGRCQLQLWSPAADGWQRRNAWHPESVPGPWRDETPSVDQRRLRRTLARDGCHLLCRGVLVGGAPIEQYAARVMAGGTPAAVVTAEHSMLLDSMRPRRSRFFRLLSHAVHASLLPAEVDPALAWRLVSWLHGALITGDNGEVVVADAHAGTVLARIGLSDRPVGTRFDEESVPDSAVLRRWNAGGVRSVEVQTPREVLLAQTIPVPCPEIGVAAIKLLTLVTQQRRQQREIMVKSAVVQETHHRVKNSLQTVASLLRIQSRREQSPTVRRALQQSVQRILGIAAVHDLLSRDASQTIGARELVQEILDHDLQMMLASPIDARVEGDDFELDSRGAVPFSLVVNELIQNAIEHGVSGRPHAQLRVELARQQRMATVTVRDDGPGFAADFSSEDAGSLGLQIAHSLVHDDLHGELQFATDGGGVARVVFPLGE